METRVVFFQYLMKKNDLILLIFTVDSSYITIIQQKINTKSAFVEEKKCQQTVSKLNSNKKIELSSPFHPSVLSTLPIAEGKKLFCINTNFLQTLFKAFFSRMPKLLVKLQEYLEKYLEGSSFLFQNKLAIDRSMYELFQLCTGLGIKRKQIVKTK